MTQDEIIRMAREAGFGHSNFHNGFQLLAPSTICTNLLTRFAALVAAHEREKHLNLANEVAWSVALAEREACAKVVENDCHDDMTRAEEAAAIRARGEK